MSVIEYSSKLRHLIHQLPAAQRELLSARSVGGVMATIAAEARRFCGYERAAVFVVHGGCLLATPSDPLDHLPSDAFRRRVLAARPRIEAGTPEAAVIREAEGTRTPHCRRPSALAELLDLHDPVFVPLAPEMHVIALLVMDRPTRSVDSEVVVLFGHVAGTALERAIREQRTRELSAEMRYLTASAEAMMREAVEAPLEVPLDSEARTGIRSALAPGSGSGWRDVLSEREYEIAELVAQGRSNREIASTLHLSAETVKGYVSRLLPKLGATNRVQVATRFLGAVQ